MDFRVNSELQACTDVWASAVCYHNKSHIRYCICMIYNTSICYCVRYNTQLQHPITPLYSAPYHPAIQCTLSPRYTVHPITPLNSTPPITLLNSAPIDPITLLNSAPYHPAKQCCINVPWQSTHELGTSKKSGHCVFS